MTVDPRSTGLIAGLGLSGFPGIALVGVETHIAARTGRSAPSDLAPCCRMRIVGQHDVVEQSALEEGIAAHVAPVRCFQVSGFCTLQELVLLCICKLRERPAGPCARFGIEGAQAAPPSLTLAGHLGGTIAIGDVSVQLAVDERSDRNGRTRGWLRNDPRSDGAQRRELVG